MAVDVAATHARAETRFRQDYELRLRRLEESLREAMDALSTDRAAVAGQAARRPGPEPAGAPVGTTPWWRTEWHRTMDAFATPMFVVDRQANVLSYNEAALRIVFAHRGLILAGGDGCGDAHDHADLPPGECQRAPLSRNCVVREAVGRAFEGVQTRNRTVRFVLPEGQGGKAATITSRVSAAPLDRDVALLLIEPAATG